MTVGGIPDSHTRPVRARSDLLLSPGTQRDVVDTPTSAILQDSLMRRVLIVAVLALLVVPAACAKDGVLFARPAAHAGDRLVLKSSWAAHPDGVAVYFMPLAVSPRWWHGSYNGWETPNNGPPPKRVRGVLRLGTLHSSTGHAVRLVTKVPRVKPGRYVLGFWCAACNEHWTSALPNFQPNPLGVLRVVR